MMPSFYIVEDEPSREEILLDTIQRIAASALRRGYAPHGKAFNVCSRDIGNCLFEYPATYTGYASKKVLANKYFHYTNGTKFRFTPDHIWPRQYAGNQIILTVYEYGIVVKAVVKDLVLKFSQVTYVTSEENNLLSKYQDSKEFMHPELAYREAGVQTVAWPAGTKITKLPEMYPELVVSSLEDINTIS